MTNFSRHSANAHMLNGFAGSPDLDFQQQQKALERRKNDQVKVSLNAAFVEKSYNRKDFINDAVTLAASFSEGWVKSATGEPTELAFLYTDGDGMRRKLSVHDVLPNFGNGIGAAVRRHSVPTAQHGNTEQQVVSQVNNALQQVLRRAKTACTNSERDASYWQRRSVEILGCSNTPPLVNVKSEHCSQAMLEHLQRLDKRTQAIRRELSSGSGVNDASAVIETEALGNFADGGSVTHLTCFPCDYATVKAMREASVNTNSSSSTVSAYQISANALVICPEESKILVQKRIAKPGSALHGVNSELLHTFGGGYLATRLAAVEDLGSLVRTARREIFEESNLALPLVEIPGISLRQDVPSFYQYAFLGWPISSKELRSLAIYQTNPEGLCKTLPYAEVVSSLSDPDQWVTAGMATIAVWLGLGAPGAFVDANFASSKLGEKHMTALDAFNKVLDAWNNWNPRA